MELALCMCDMSVSLGQPMTAPAPALVSAATASAFAPGPVEAADVQPTLVQPLPVNYSVVNTSLTFQLVYSNYYGYFTSTSTLSAGRKDAAANTLQEYNVSNLACCTSSCHTHHILEVVEITAAFFMAMGY